MSLDGNKGKYRQEIIKKKIEVIATEKDIDALIKSVQEIERMFNVDLQKGDADYPARITIRDEIDPEAVMYPRTARYLRKLRKSLKDETNVEALTPVNIIGERSSYNKDGIENLMEYILWGGKRRQVLLSNKPKTSYVSMVSAIDTIIRNPVLRPDMIKKMNPEMIHIDNLNTHQGVGLDDKAKASLHAMLNVDVDTNDYPPDLGAGYSQGYVVMMRTETTVPLSTPTGIKDKEWKMLLRSFNLDKGKLHPQYKRTPKTTGELFNFMFAYVTGQTMGMKESLVVPFAKNRYPIETELVQGNGEEFATGKKEIKGYRYVHKAVVVGKGPFGVSYVIGSGKGANFGSLRAKDIPGFKI